MNSDKPEVRPFLKTSDLIFFTATMHEWVGRSFGGISCWLHGCWPLPSLITVGKNMSWPKDDSFGVRQTCTLILTPTCPDNLNYDQLSYGKTQVPCPSNRVTNTYHEEFWWGWKEAINKQVLHGACKVRHPNMLICLFVCFPLASLLINIVETWM